MFEKMKKHPGADDGDLIYADAQSGEPGRKKRPELKRQLLIHLLALGAAVIAVMVSTMLWLRMEQRRDSYELAQSLLAAKKYPAAMAEFRELGNYRDSRAMAAWLTEQAASYAAAEELEAQQRYSEAIAAFRALGDYSDSAQRAACGVTYRMALDLMTEIDVGKTQLLTRILAEQVRLTDENSYPTTVGYEVAAALLESLGDYESAPALIDRCYYSAGLVKLGWEDWDGALAYMEKMSEETAAEFYEDYLQRYREYTEKEGQ